MAKDKYLMSEEDLASISDKYAKVTDTDPEAWSKYIRLLESEGKFTPENFEILEELSGGKAREFATGLSMAITNAERKAKEEYYQSGESLDGEATEETTEAVVHCGFPTDGNEAIKAKLADDGLLSWIVDEDDDVMHKGVKGSKWGYNKGAPNGKRQKGQSKNTGTTKRVRKITRGTTTLYTDKPGTRGAKPAVAGGNGVADFLKWYKTTDSYKKHFGSQKKKKKKGKK